MNIDGLWTTTKPLYVYCTIYFTKSGEKIIDSVKISNFCFQEDVYVEIKYIDCYFESNLKIYTLEDVFEPFSKCDYHPLVHVELSRQHEEMNYAQEKSFLSFLNLLQTKTSYRHINIICSEKSKIPISVTKYKVNLCAEVTEEEYVLPCCTDVNILTVKKSSRVFLHPSVKGVTVSDCYTDDKKVEVFFEGQCPNLKFLLFKNVCKKFQWNNMKDFLLKHTHAEFVYLDFNIETNK